MLTIFSLVVYVKPPHARPNKPSATRIIPSALFTAALLWRRWLEAVTEQSEPPCLQPELCALRRELVHLLFEYLFNLAGFLLDFAGEFFVLAFGFQVGVARDLSGCLFDVAFQFMKLAFDLIFRTRFHLVSPLSLLRTFHKKLFPVFGEVALLLFGLAQPLECHVVPDHISRSAALSCIIAVEAWSNCQRQEDAEGTPPARFRLHRDGP